MDSHFSRNGHFWPKRAIFKTFSGRQAMNTLCRFLGYLSHYSLSESKMVLSIKSQSNVPSSCFLIIMESMPIESSSSYVTGCACGNLRTCRRSNSPNALFGLDIKALLPSWHTFMLKESPLGSFICHEVPLGGKKSSFAF